MTATHSHRCRCGAELRCTVEPDKCAVIDVQGWECPTCELARRDDYLSQLEPAHQPLLELEQTT